MTHVWLVGSVLLLASTSCKKGEEPYRANLDKAYGEGVVGVMQDIEWKLERHCGFFRVTREPITKEHILYRARRLLWEGTDETINCRDTVTNGMVQVSAMQYDRRPYYYWRIGRVQVPVRQLLERTYYYLEDSLSPQERREFRHRLDTRPLDSRRELWRIGPLKVSLTASTGPGGAFVTVERNLLKLPESKS